MCLLAPIGDYFKAHMGGSRGRKIWSIKWRPNGYSRVLIMIDNDNDGDG